MVNGNGDLVKIAVKKGLEELEKRGYVEKTGDNTHRATSYFNKVFREKYIEITGALIGEDVSPDKVPMEMRKFVLYQTLTDQFPATDEEVVYMSRVISILIKPKSRN